VDTFHWLLWLTIIYVFILVIALAAGLIAIARALVITRNNFAKIAEVRAQVDFHTRPLANSLGTINTVLTQAAGDLSVLLQSLKSADRNLEAVAGKIAAGR
jgi:hypothetical protein